MPASEDLGETLLPFLTMWQQVVPLRVFERLGKGIRETPRDALIGLSETKKNLGRAFGFRKLFDSLGAIAGPLLATFIAVFFFNNVYTEQTYRTIFLVAIVPAVIAVIVLLFLKEMPSPTTVPRIAFNHIFGNRNVRNFIFVMSFLYLGNFSMMFFLLRANDYLPLFAVPIAYIAYNAAYTAFSLPVGIMADKIGAKKTVLVAMLLFLSVLVGFTFFPSMMAVFLLFIMLGFFTATAKTVPQVFLVEHMKNNNYASAIGSYKGLTGLASLPANLIAGFLWTIPLFGAPATFIFSMAIACLAIVFLVLFVRDESPY
ncbi:MFS transporter [Candidatus Micrarchaeota archaeon]|nr:MFS transporter [Candidatus Micrarchaeota archaeon]